MRASSLVLTAAATIALLGFAAAGPLHSGWAKAAGTPDRLLAANGGTTTTRHPRRRRRRRPRCSRAGLSDQLTGTVAQTDTGVRVSFTDSRDPTLRIVIAVAGQATTGQLLVTEGGATVCDVTAAVSQDVRATCGQTVVDITATQQADGTIAGQLVTTGPGQ